MTTQLPAFDVTMPPARPRRRRIRRILWVDGENLRETSAAGRVEDSTRRAATPQPARNANSMG